RRGPACATAPPGGSWRNRGSRSWSASGSAAGRTSSTPSSEKSNGPGGATAPPGPALFRPYGSHPQGPSPPTGDELPERRVQAEVDRDAAPRRGQARGGGRAGLLRHRRGRQRLAGGRDGHPVRLGEAGVLRGHRGGRRRRRDGVLIALGGRGRD